MHIHVDKMRGNNAWETVKMRKKNKFMPFHRDYHEIIFA